MNILSCFLLNRRSKNVRTAALLESTFAYVLTHHCFLKKISILNPLEEKILNRIKEYIDVFKLNYYQDMIIFLHNLEENVNIETIVEEFFRYANEIFPNGNISWFKMIAYFVFAGEYSEKCISKGMPTNVLPFICDCCFSRYVEENLMQFVDNQGGWDKIPPVPLHKPSKRKKTFLSLPI